MFYDGHSNTAGGAEAKGRSRVHLRVASRRAASSRVRADIRCARPVDDALIGSLDEDGVGALLRLFEDARNVLRSGGGNVDVQHEVLLDALLAAFATRRAVAWSHVFRALARIEAYAEAGTPALLRIRGFLGENADLAVEAG